MSILDKYLEEEHKNASKDFEEGKDTYGKDDDDKIGRIHDMVQDLWNHTFSKEEFKKDEEKDVKDIKDGGKEELKEVEEDRKEEKHE